MLKAVFILEKLTKEKVAVVKSLGANAIFVPAKNLRSTNSNYLNNWSGKLYVEFPTFIGEDWWKKYPESINSI